MCLSWQLSLQNSFCFKLCSKAWILCIRSPTSQNRIQDFAQLTTGSTHVPEPYLDSEGCRSMGQQSLCLVANMTGKQLFKLLSTLANSHLLLIGLQYKGPDSRDLHWNKLKLLELPTSVWGKEFSLDYNNWSPAGRDQLPWRNCSFGLWILCQGSQSFWTCE